MKARSLLKAFSVGAFIYLRLMLEVNSHFLNILSNYLFLNGNPTDTNPIKSYDISNEPNIQFKSATIRWIWHKVCSTKLCNFDANIQMPTKVGEYHVIENIFLSIEKSKQWIFQFSETIVTSKLIGDFPWQCRTWIRSITTRPKSCCIIIELWM